MSQPLTKVIVEFEAHAVPIEGFVRAEGSEHARPFCGWLALVSALEAIVAGLDAEGRS